MTYCCLDMSARDYSKFGLLFSRDGNWDGKQVVSKSYVDESAIVLTKTPYGMDS